MYLKLTEVQKDFLINHIRSSTFSIFELSWIILYFAMNSKKNLKDVMNNPIDKFENKSSIKINNKDIVKIVNKINIIVKNAIHSFTVNDALKYIETKLNRNYTYKNIDKN